MTSPIRANALIDPREVAAALAHATDEQQGEFFEVFIKELQVYCVSQFAAQQQAAMAGDHIPHDDNTQAVLECLLKGKQ